MRTSQAGISLIHDYEKCRLTAYRDIKGVPTIGWGTTSGVTMGQTITQAQADAFFARDLARFEAIVSSRIKVPLNQGQFDSLVSLAYNCGSAPLTGTLGRVLNEGRYDAVPAQFMRWVNSGPHKNVKGLIRRRRDEVALWRSLDTAPDVEVSAPVTATPARPLTDSGTIKGVALVGGGAVAAGSQALDQVQTSLTTVSGIVGALGTLQGSLVLVAVLAMVGGLVWIAYRRYADRGMIL